MKTPLENYPRLSSAFSIDLKVKRDDLYPFTGGGNKARKMDFILKDAIHKNADALVTAGAANSNHARVVAITGAQLGWPVHIVVHGNDDNSNGNLHLMKLTGASLTFVEKNEVSEVMDSVMDDFKKEGYNPFYIMGGGHTLQGMLAYFEAVDEFLTQSDGWLPDYVILASGTGGTHAGLHVGFAKHSPKTSVFGISVARKKKRGKKILTESISELFNKLGIPEINNEIHFLDHWTGGGYEQVYPELTESIKKAAELEGLITDPTYTGKALTALFEMCEKRVIEKESRVLFWHTGGMINLLKNNSLL